MNQSARASAYNKRSDICVKAGLNDSNQCYQMKCIVCVHTVEIYIKSADRQDKALFSSSKGDLIDSGPVMLSNEV